MVEKKLINWENLSRLCVLLLAFLLPIWVLPFSGLGIAMSKSLLIFILTLVASLFYLIYILQEGMLKYPKSRIVLSLFAILLITFCSSVFSGIFPPSFFGTGSGTGTFCFLLALSIIFLLTTLLFSSEKHILMFLFLLVFSSVVLFFTQFVHSILGVKFGGVLVSVFDSLVGGWNELAIFFGLAALMSVIFLEFFGAKLSELSSGRVWRFFLYSIIAMSLLVMAFINFTTVWIVFGIFLLVLFVYLFSTFGKTTNFARLPFFIVLIVVFFILARPLMGDLVTAMSLNSLDIRPSWQATFNVVKSVWASGIKSALIGSGAETFVYDWLHFKPAAINQTVFWNTRFQNGIGFLPSLAATTGLLGVLAWIVFLAGIIYYGLKTMSYGENSIIKSLLFSTFLGAVYLWIFSIIYTPTHFLLTLTFMMTGLFFAILIRSGRLKLGEFSFINKGSLGFVSSMVIVLLIISSVAAFYGVFQKYWAAYSYNRGLIVFNIEGNVSGAEEYFLKAIRFDSTQDRYYRALTQLGLVRLSSFLNQPQQASDEEVRIQFQNMLFSVIQYAQNATIVNPRDSFNWMNLGQVYQNLISLNIAGADTVALNSYARAREESPLDPTSLLASAQIQIQSKNIDGARSFLEQAVNLKNDYTSALFLLAQLDAQKGDLDNAIRQTELARLTSPNDVGVLFQLGLLYYQKKDYKNAQAVLERAVGIVSDYSNARYFLGLSYDNLGRTEEAIAQFEAIKNLNPDNSEVKKILDNLKVGRSALSSISPPEPAPEQRENPPIKDEQSTGSELR